MRVILIAGLALVASVSVAAAKPTRLWNLTNNTIEKFELAPAGTDRFGPDLCKNDKDGAVDHDERLKIVGIPSGKYDARFTDDKGRSCIVKNLSVTEGEVFTIEEKQLTDCKR